MRIAVTGAKRSTLIPDVPTLQETGVDIVSQGAVWVYGPAGMPADLVYRMGFNPLHSRVWRGQ